MAETFQQILQDLRDGHGTKSAQEALYGLASGALLEPLRTKLPQNVRSRLDAEDVLHEAVVRALKNLHTAEITTEKQFLAWVYKIARNLTLDQAKRRSAAAVPFASSSSSGTPKNGPRLSQLTARTRAPESRLARRDEIDRILSRMPEAEAEVLRRRWLLSQEVEEIAAALDRTPKAIKGLYSRACRRFKELADSQHE